MKTTVVTTLLLIAHFAHAQVAQDTFVTGKKSVTLRTGISMKYVEAGDPNGIPLLLLHGFTDTSRSFEPMIAHLLRINKNFRVIAPDLRGHGGTTMPDAATCSDHPEKCFSQAMFIVDIISLLDTLHIQKVNVVGHSMGSWIAQGLAVQHHKRVDHLILIGTFVNGKALGALQQFMIKDLIEGTWRTMLERQPGFVWPEDAYAKTPAMLGDDVTKFLRDYWVSEACADNYFLNKVHAETISTPLGTWIGAARAIAVSDMRSAIAGLKIPTLILWATQDAFMVASDQEDVKAAFRKAGRAGVTMSFKTYGKLPVPEGDQPFSELGHNLQWAAPYEVAGDVIAFITTGSPLNNFSYADPRDPRHIISEKAVGNIEVLR